MSSSPTSASSAVRAVAGCALLWASPLLAHPMPRIPKEQIPDDMPPEIRRQVERLYSANDAECTAGAKALGEMGPAAAPAAAFLASVLDRHRSCPTPNAAADSLIAIGRASVEPTILALGVGDAYGRTRAVRVLRQLRDPRAIGALANAVADGIGGREAVSALVELGGTEYLRNAARDDNPAVRQMAMRTLPVLGTAEAAGILASAIEDDDGQVRLLAAQGLLDVASRTPGIAGGHASAILSCLRAPEAEARRCAIRLIAHLSLGPRQTLDALAPLLEDPDADIRADVLAALGAMKSAKAVPLIRRMEGHANATLRAATAAALGQCGQTSAVQSVEALLSDPEGIVREQAIRSLVALKGRAVVPRLAEMLRRDPDPLVRRRVLQVLSEWNAAGALGSLEPLLADDDEAVRIAALDLAQGTAGGRSLLLSGLSNGVEKVREHAYRLSERGFRAEAGDAPILLALLASRWPDTRRYAARLLARDPGLAQPTDEIVRAADDRDPEVQAAAIAILGRHRDTRRLESMRTAARSYHEGLALAAVSALAQLGDVQSLAQATRHWNERVRNSALSLLTRAGTPEARDALAAIQKQPGRADLLPQIASAVSDGPRRGNTPEMLVTALRYRYDPPNPTVRAQLVALGTNAVPALSGLLASGPPTLRASVIAILEEIGGPAALETVLRAAADPDADVRECAVRALARQRGEQAVSALVKALADPAPAVREESAAALGMLDDSRARDALLSAVGTEDWHLRAQVLRSLGRTRDERAADALRDGLADPDWRVRGAAAEALGNSADRRSIPSAIAALADPHWSVRAAAAASLRGLTGVTNRMSAAAWQAWWTAQAPADPARDMRRTEKKSP